MNKLWAVLGVGLLLAAASHADTGARWIGSSWKLAEAIGADLIDDKEPAGSASTPAPETPPAPESQPAVPEPRPVISDTAA